MTKHVQTVINDRLDRRNSGEPRYRNKFEPKHERLIQFWDTKKLLLAANNYALRVRTEAQGQASDKGDLTLKLRTPDIFFAAGTELPGVRDGADTEFEEDISPLILAANDEAGGGNVIRAQPPTMRSRFALSTKQPVARSLRLETLADVFDLYPTLEAQLEKHGGGRVKRDARLRAGPMITEFVYENATVDLGDDVDAEFSFSLWFFDGNLAEPAVAEISFKYAIGDGRLSKSTARRAFLLFTGMQESLKGWLNTRETSKTALALPRKGRGD